MTETTSAAAGMTPTVAAHAETLHLPGIALELFTRGSGRPLLFLHSETGARFAAPWAAELAAKYRLLAASHPGFGGSELPRWMSSVDDIAYTYLDLMEALDLRDAIVVGVGFGAWIAAEIAVKSTQRIGRLVLVNALGIKVGDRETRDIVDIFATKQSELLSLAYHDPATGAIDASTMTEDEAVELFRNREAAALFGWSPYMHNPKLRHLLHRINVPTLVLWGESDRIVLPRYGRAFAEAIPGARFETIAAAGHFPHLEQPRLFAERVVAFADAAGPPKGSSA